MNIIEFVQTIENLSFNERPFDEIDNLILCAFGYLDIKNEANNSIKTIDEIINKKIDNKTINNKLGLIIPSSFIDLAIEIHDKKRYKDIKIVDHINEIDNVSQFSANTYIINDDLIAVSYRGTDDTLIGWFEDFSQIKSFPIPSEIKGVNYLNNIGKKFKKAKIYVSGHSKGGAIATYSAINANNDIKKRIVSVYSFDGQGMNIKEIDENKVKSIISKITLFTPRESLIGQLFDKVCNKEIIVDAKDIGINQHSLSNWLFDKSGFKTIKSHNTNAIKYANYFNNIVSNLTEVQKEQYTNELYDSIKDLNRSTLTDLKKDILKLLFSKPTTSKEFRKVINSLIKEYIKNLSVVTDTLKTIEELSPWR